MDPHTEIVLSVLHVALGDAEEEQEQEQKNQHRYRRGGRFLNSLVMQLKEPFETLVQLVGRFQNEDAFLSWASRTIAQLKTQQRWNTHARNILRISEALTTLNSIGTMSYAPRCLQHNGWRGFMNALCLRREFVNPARFASFTTDIAVAHARALRLRHVIIKETVTSRGTISRSMNWKCMQMFEVIMVVGESLQRF